MKTRMAESIVSLKFAKLKKSALAPVRGSANSAGWDLFSNEDGSIEPGQRHLFKSDLVFQFPPGTYGQIVSRAGLALKNGVYAIAGSIDPGYRGNVGVLLLNGGNEPYYGMQTEQCA